MSNYNLNFTRTAIEKRVAEIENSQQLAELKPISLKDLMVKEFPEIDWVVEKLAPAEGIIAISGMPTAYKTWLVLDLAIKVALGIELFGRFMTHRIGVLIVDEETGERWIKERIKKISDNYELPIYFLSKSGFKLTEESTRQLIAFAKSRDVGVIVFDSLLRIHTARDENDAVQMGNVFGLFQRLTKEGLTVIFTHHHRKQGTLRSKNISQDMRGSSDILAAVDCHLAVDRKDDDLVVIHQTKLRQGEEVKPFQLNVIREENEWRFEFAGEIEEQKTKQADFKGAIKDLLEREDKPMYKKEIFETLREAGLEGGYSTFKAAIQNMVEKGELFEKPGAKNKTYCSIKPFDQEQQLFIESGGG